jgi:enamine deaminase RidA (YjgF/YER057c/UK114 family)
MAEIEAKLASMGLHLPAPIKLPPGLVLPFSWVRLRGNRAYVSGHIALGDDGSPAQPFGKLGTDLTIEQGYEASRRAALAMLSSLRAKLGDLDRITAWLRVFGMVNTGAGFTQFPAVINGFSDLIVALYGPERGDHTRSAVGLADLPFGTPVEIEAEVEINPPA